MSKSDGRQEPHIPLTARRADPPDLNRLGGDPFQDLSRDIFSEEPEIRSCEVYGPQGQSDFGVDLLAHRNDGGVEVSQCKCYRKFSKAKIAKASQAFLKHWKRWEKRGVKRFVLLVACKLERTEQQDTIRDQVTLFAQYGIAYEAWSLTTIVEKLRPHPGIVSSHIGMDWVERICGTRIPMSTVHEKALVLHNEQMASLLDGIVEEKVQRMRTAWREGKTVAALEMLSGVIAERSLWVSLSPAVQSKVLRFKSSVSILSGGTAAVRVNKNETVGVRV